ncbi:hypothetical protein JCM3765_001548 [Sporobolomyces pararoseus]
MSHYRPFDSSSSSTLRPPTSSRPSKEDRTTKERIDVLLERLDRTKDILVHDCSKGDRFGLLALGTLERNLKELVPVIKMIEQSRSVGKEEVEVNRAQEEESRSRKAEEQEERPRSRSNATSVFEDRPSETRRPANGRTAARHDDTPIEILPPTSSRRSSDSPSTITPASRPLPLSRAESTISSSDSTKPRPEEPSSARSSITKFFNRAKETVSPSTVLSTTHEATRSRPVEEQEEEEARLDREVARKDRHRRQISVASDSSTSAPTLNSRPPQRTIKPLSDDEDRDHELKKTTHSRSRAGSRAPSRAGTGRSQEVQKALEMASAPPGSSDESSRDTRRRGGRQDRKKRVVVVRLDEEDVIRGIARASDQVTRSKLLLVSEKYRKMVEPIIYSHLTVGSINQAEKLTRTFESNSGIAKFVTSLEITPLDSSSRSSDPQSLVEPLQRLISLFPHLETFKEDFTKSDWDVSDSSLYPLSLSSPACSLKSFTSSRCWWEIGALRELFNSQPGLARVVLGGAAMDREWEGTKLKSNLLSNPPTSQIESLEVAQVMHEDTLSVLLLLSRNPRFSTLRISFQSIGPSDDDTPLSSIPSALKLIGSTLTHLTLLAPNQVSSARVSEDTSIFLEEILVFLPNLITLEFQETCLSIDSVPVPICSVKIFNNQEEEEGGGGGILSRNLKTLRIRGLFSISTKEVLNFLLQGDPEVIPVLEELDLEWASKTKKEEEEVEFEREEEDEWYDEREAVKIRRVCEEFGIRCKVGKGNRKFIIG